MSSDAIAQGCKESGNTGVKIQLSLIVRKGSPVIDFVILLHDYNALSLVLSLCSIKHKHTAVIVSPRLHCTELLLNIIYRFFY